MTTKYKHTLTKDEEMELHARRLNGDSEAFAKLCESVMPWGIEVARRIFGYRSVRVESYEELESIAGLAAVQAVLHFDPRKGRLTTYMEWWVKQVAFIELHERHLIHIPRHLIKQGATHSLRMDAADKIRNAAFGPIDDVKDNHHHPVASPSLAEQMRDSAAQRLQIDVVLSLMGHRSATIIGKHLLEGKTLQAIGDELGLTKEGVRQIELKAKAEFQVMWTHAYGDDNGA